MVVHYTGSLSPPLFFRLLLTFVKKNSFAGIGIGTDSASDLAGKINSVNRKAKDRWINTKVLIIDESKAQLYKASYFFLLLKSGGSLISFYGGQCTL